MEAVWKRIRNDIREYHHAVFLLGIYYAAGRVCFRAFCPFLVITGLPCPGCGLSRSCLYLLKGQFARSFSLHPLGGIWLLFLCSFLIHRYVVGKKCPKWMLWLLALLLLATLFLYVVRMALLFPDRPPMSYTGRNLFEKIIPDYREKILSFWKESVKLW